MDYRSIYYRRIVWGRTGRAGIAWSAAKMVLCVVLFFLVAYGARVVRGNNPSEAFGPGPIGGAIVIFLAWLASVYKTVEAGYAEFVKEMEEESEQPGGQRTV